ncbi:mechanosensitive ion channel protein MscS [Sulfitobacter alexandrii]|uniref:Mechanosensitive ion channel protein MscS n=2 Tax=Sulfitobacter alexandrii TaxID=1917485 RepID=A0A1J0WMM2_9RHOB|nr:mechanosensitive ion channel protein MscS [Sulfitobacter alexandrii]
MLLFMTLAMFFLTPQDGVAQVAGPLLATDGSDPAPENGGEIGRIIRQASESGVGVIVIDTDGNILNRPAEVPAETPAATEQDTKSPLMAAQDRVVRFRAALVERLLLLPNAVNEVLYILRAASPDGTLWAFGKALLISLGLFGVGALFERYVFGRRIARGFVTSRVMENPRGYVEKMPFLVMRFGVGVLGILVSMLVAYILGFLIFGTLEDTAMQFTVSLINIGYFACRVVAGLWRMILSPFLSQYRIPHFSDRDARKLHRWLWSLAVLDICAILFGIWIAELGLNYDVYAFLSAGMSAVIVLINVLMVLVNRRAISLALRNGKPIAECSLVVRFLSRAWAPAMIVYVFFAWFELTYDLVLANPSSIPLIAGAYGILLSIIVVYGVINYVIERTFARARAIRRMNEKLAEEETQEAELASAAKGEGNGAEEERLEGELARTRAAVAEEEARLGTMHQQHLNTFEALAGRVAGILAFVAGIYAFFYIWDNEGAQMVESYADRFLDVLVILLIGYVIYHAFRIWIDNKIAEEAGEETEVELGDEGGGSSASRLATLLPLFRNFVLILVVVTLVLIVLMELGINVGPLFAGAGIVGVAIGFGSQALVRDIFAGAFFLFDDAFRKGEYLDVGDVKGTVEKISVRSFQLRHHLGALHTIAFGELQVITNYSRDWVMMKLPLRVTYDTDVEKVRKLIKKLGQELLEDPVIGDNFIQPLKSQGVIEMQDSAMIIRVKFMTKPGDQWLVRKRVYEDIRALFEREGIKFAHREVTVRLADGKVADLSEEDRRAITAAAQAHIDEEDMEGMSGSGDDR